MARKTSGRSGFTAAMARDIKVAHSVFALPFAFLAAFMAYPGWPGEASAVMGADDWVGRAGNGALRLGLILLAMVCARTYAMLINRYLDRDLDALNPRTAKRAIPAGLVMAGDVKRASIICAVGLVASAVAFGVLDGNWWPTAFSPVVLAWLGLYPLAKRYTAGCHYILGGALALSPLSAAIAINPVFLGDVTIWFLAGFVCLWVAGFDIIYAVQDMEFDKEHKVHSMPAKLGKNDALYVSTATHFAAALLLAMVLLTERPMLSLWVFGPAVVLTIVVLAYEQRAAAHNKFEMAFFTLNGVIAILLGVTGILDVVLG